MRPALDSAGHRVPRTKPTCLLHTWRPHRRRPFALVLHLYQHQSSRNLHLQYLAKSQSTQRCQSLITPGSDHPPVLEPRMVLTNRLPRRSRRRRKLRWGGNAGESMTKAVEVALEATTGRNQRQRWRIDGGLYKVGRGRVWGTPGLQWRLRL
jgi:hypothetical protein